ncbi:MULTISPECIES: exodeoxyribonuclease I [unclassified Undibacterium]|uniref:exodeoxyribonuclease I n=1 Tax=unclassified Undibacterium TaxID=2630295 RepID=UPI002AC93E21|nr:MULTISPECIES: exodeoxyribonuclease I [unclassified Undibacterium]MEB0137520.1 exodeoxyribonuclease I [Undibacterium sp. CCC2.1]MEB0170815.1 exodeoxyribonuclease I [Undibacterium sp. CCC1.1]MEB0174767.1 exodeoxyribonuclease I [Undibacterium sp. CCC3.4]MEB0214103.1 exodeoxyribonuclease I [Undibacterium sp. 5I2]WPX44419.1 exodeoxyribonuclease I [Undibacterium sp. CCC3.4]
MQDISFLWHDYETFGAVPRRDRPAQFAAIRTDAELNEIGSELMLYCQPAPDFLPEPQACLITGITPQLCLERGVTERAFASTIEAAFATPGTVGVGYNSIRFDDEVTRFLFWRNLIDPYAREWQNNCSRWDLLDVARTAYALRPDGIQWPRNPDGKASFRLEHLTTANGLTHAAAHDALSDVRATIAFARLLREKNQKLFDFCLGLRKKDRVMEEIGWPRKKPLLHITGMVPAERGCLAVVWPLAFHPTNKNELIVWDLEHDPRQLFELSVEEIQLRMFSKAADLPEGVTRLPLKTIHINKSPIVISNLKTLSAERAAHWGIDMAQAQLHAQAAATAPDMTPIWDAVFARPALAGNDVDEDLYNGFIGKEDRRLLNEVRQLPPAALAQAQPDFQDSRLTELLFRYRARNYPDSLSATEQQRWETHRSARLHEGAGNALTVERYFEIIDQCSEEADVRAEEILGALYDYAEHITPAR